MPANPRYIGDEERVDEDAVQSAKAELEQRVEELDQIIALEDQPGWRRFTDQLATQEMLAVDALTGEAITPPKTMEAMRGYQGRLRVLRWAKEFTTAARKEREEALQALDALQEEEANA